MFASLCERSILTRSHSGTLVVSPDISTLRASRSSWKSFATFRTTSLAPGTSKAPLTLPQDYVSRRALLPRRETDLLNHIHCLIAPLQHPPVCLDGLLRFSLPKSGTVPTSSTTTTLAIFNFCLWPHLGCSSDEQGACRSRRGASFQLIYQEE